MKKIFFAFLALAFINAQAQTLTVDDVIQKYTAAMGGLDNFNKIKTAKITGTVSAQGMDLPITIQIINGRAMRTDVEVMGQSITNAYKDGKGWKINPFQGASTATDATPAELNDFKAQANLASTLMDYKKRGATVELLGQEDVEGVKTYKIKMIGDDKKETTFFIGANDFMMVKSVSKRDMMGQEMEVATFYSNAKDFGGVKFTMTRSQQVEGQVMQEIKMDKVEIDVPIDEKVFEKG